MPKRVLQGAVVSDKMDKTVVVSVERRTTHRLYKKVITRTTKYHAHDEANACTLGDKVRIEESRPYSRTKRWRVIEILTRGDVAEISPENIGRDLEANVQRSPSGMAEAEAEAEAEGVADETAPAEPEDDKE